ncbi:Swi2 Snf2 ATpase [Cryptosporidium sp. chipmunk genotype I]|uniref:Swi2 Snf2 ATpase n=1 Tax=Cryptosporidium sp. chipmunk genotype I TaxID=1280935 RepID=UPI00351A77F2|nr:Swi2 Snf2 ATpase [Cryptosporidium sp. chipmunk genotype I]
MADPDLGEMLNSRKPIVLLNDAYWEPKVKEWVPNLKIDELDEEQKSIIEQKLFVVVLTPSNISRCAVCGKIIAKGTYRLGVPEYDRRGMYGIINRWNHISPCSQKYLKKAIQGYESNLDEIEGRISEVIYGWSCLPIGIRDEFLDLCTKEIITESNEFTIENSDDLVSRSIVEVKPTPINLTYELLQFQKEGLAWLCNQENSIARGGILADEMGMGKTIQTISLILEHDIPPITNNAEKGEVIGKNLVVAPVAAVLQWKQEIERFTKPGSLKVHIYHGSKRNKNQGNKGTKQDYGGVDIGDANVVITTYPTLEAEYRKIASAFKSKCPYCDRSFLKRNLKIHLRYFCGPNSMRTAKQALTERKNEGLKKAMRTLKIGLEEGVDKAKQLEDIARSLPTISNVYREILAKADLLDDDSLSSALPWFTSRRKSQKSVKNEDTINFLKKNGSKEKAQKTEIIKDEHIEENLTSLLEWGGLKLPLKSETVKSIKDFLSSIENSKEYLSTRFNISGKILDSLIELYDGCKSLRKAELVDKLSNILGLDIPNCNSKEANNLGLNTKKTPRSISNSNKRANIKSSNSKKSRKKKKYEDEFEDEYSAEEESIDEYSEEYEDSEEALELNTKGRKSAKNQRKKQNDDDEYKVVEEIGDVDDDDEDDNEEEEIIQKLREYSGIFERSWNRIILDEAHRIKARTTSTAKAIFALKSRGTKWCLTGTPLQNRVGELYSLVRFIGFHPYAYNFCQKGDCDCRQLNYVTHLKFCSFCGHARSCHYSYFNKLIINPIKRYGFSGEGSEALRRLKEEVLDKVLLRRTKVQRQEDVKLPPLEIKVINNELSAPEKDFYTSLYQRSKVQFDTYVNQGTVLHNYAHVFDLISRLRQAVDHPYLIVYGKFNHKRDLEYKKEYKEEGDDEYNEENEFMNGSEDEKVNIDSNKVIPSKSRADNNEDLCYICMDNVTIDQRVTSKCKHGFHIKCIKEYIEQAPQEDEIITDFETKDNQAMRGVLGCPVCYVPLTIDFNKISNLTTKNKKFKSVYDDMNDEENDTNDNIESEQMQEQIERELERIEMAKQLGIDVKKEDLKQETRQEKEEILSCVRNKFITRQIKTKGFESSTKIDTLLEEVNKMMQEDPESKGIVFSQFTNMLDLVSYRLKKANIGCVMLAGSMSILQRNSILYSFNKFPDLKIILISLKAGGEGLNLQVANYVFLLDPWWNPAVELQAFQRAHRIGQKKKVTALRFITKDTIEERMFQLQEKKQLVFDGTVGASNNALNKLNSDDLKFLFQN